LIDASDVSNNWNQRTGEELPEYLRQELTEPDSFAVMVSLDDHQSVADVAPSGKSSSRVPFAWLTGWLPSLTVGR
jgi:hypothetical protein